MRPDPEMIPVLIDAAEALKGSQRRLFMAKTVAAMGRGGQLWAEAHLGWNRGTIRKGMHELRSGMTCVDAFHCRRRKPAEEHLPRLLDDIRSIADGQSQADPEFQTERLFTRISAAEVRRQLIATKGYTDEQLPTQQTINRKLVQYGADPSRFEVRRLAVTAEQAGSGTLPDRATKDLEDGNRHFPAFTRACQEKGLDPGRSIEFDAIDPRELRRMVEAAIVSHADKDELRSLRKEEQERRRRLRELAEEEDS